MRSSMGRIELELRPDTPQQEVRERLCARVRHRQFLVREPRSARFRALASAILADLGDAAPASFRVSATRSDKRLPFTSPQVEREIGGMIWEAKRLEGRSLAPRADDSHRDAAGRLVLFLRQGAGRRRHAERHGRTRRLPAVGRHRLAGRRVPDDAARLHGAADSFSQLPDPVARVAGKGARDRRAADAGTSCGRG